MTRILGIDPGSRITGFGIVQTDGPRTVYVCSGCVRVSADSQAERLKIIFDGVRDLVQAHGPDEVAMEQVFVHRNVASALKLGQARGAALVGAAVHGLPVYEYTPSQIKQAITGAGAAPKEQIQHMVRMLLGLSESPAADAADALAAALCHAHSRTLMDRVPRVRHLRRGRMR